MSAPDARVPRPTAVAIALAAVAGTLALAGSSPVAALGLGSGVGLAATLRWFAGSHRRTFAAAAVLSLVVLATVAAGGLLLAPSIESGVLAPVAFVVGVGSVAMLGSRPAPDEVLRLGRCGGYAALAATAATVFGIAVLAAGSVGAVAAELARMTGAGVSGLVVAVVAAGVTTAAALGSVPTGAVATPATRDDWVNARTALAKLVVVVAVVVALLLAVAHVAGALFLPVGWVVTGLAESTLVRGALSAITLVGLATTVVGWAVWGGWTGGGVPTLAVPMLAGSAVAVGAAFGLALAAPGQPTTALPSLFGVAAIAFAVVWAVGSWTGTAMTHLEFPAVPTVVAGALGVGSVAVGATASVGISRAAVGTLVALGAALFVHDAGRYGTALGREVGPAGAERLPQLVRLAWAAGVAGFAVVVAVGGLWVATLLAPALSVPATVGAVAGVVALVTAVWLVVR